MMMLHANSIKFQTRWKIRCCVFFLLFSVNICKSIGWIHYLNMVDTNYDRMQAKLHSIVMQWIPFVCFYFILLIVKWKSILDANSQTNLFLFPRQLKHYTHRIRIIYFSYGFSVRAHNRFGQTKPDQSKLVNRKREKKTLHD